MGEKDAPCWLANQLRPKMVSKRSQSAFFFAVSVRVVNGNYNALALFELPDAIVLDRSSAMTQKRTLLDLFRGRRAVAGKQEEAVPESDLAEKLTESIKSLKHSRDDLRAEIDKLRHAMLHATKELHEERRYTKELAGENEDLELFCGRALRILSQFEGNKEAEELLKDMWAYKSDWLVERSLKR